ncbi:TPA: HAD family phosphatase [Citrobacter freundii]|uniref:HAD family hydrolase n=1 Tax=Citrobacter freundii TaxID=546 RepID=UPI001A21B4E5|nr:HAD family phosphatase [Citrobacter freundii]HAT4013277.1 HAD family phosphatase [Citrobacter freundii]HAT4018205.1 HAD family phosphatase [Citrobacter freundii]HAT4023286.1 HAD family phosphatase [Citrobacter freundii]HAT4032683.1 HAD family phosphatase [Citrobacter freundii]
MNLGAQNFTTFLFDLDGVIVDSGKTIVEAWKMAAQKYGYVISDELAKRFIIGASPEFTLAMLFPRENTQRRRIIHRLVDQWEEKADYALIPGVMVFLKALSRHNVNIGLVTSSWSEKIDNILNKHQLHMFAHIISRDDVTKGKPDPEPYLTAISRFGSRAEQTLVFEDSGHGIAAALGAGAKCIAIHNEAQKYDVPAVADFRQLCVTSDEPEWRFLDSPFGIKVVADRN